MQRKSGRRHNSPSFPQDTTLLPIAPRALLVSKEWAVFCGVPEREIPLVSQVLEGRAEIAVLSPAFRDDLGRHGFFGEPRPATPTTRSVQIQLTNDCNLSCAYCCTNSGGPRDSKIDFSSMCRLVEEVRQELGPAGTISLLGGEPFLVPWAIDLAERIIDVGLHLSVFTNGTLHGDPDLARRTAQLIRGGAEIHVSLSGPTAVLCDSVSKVPRFEVVSATSSRRGVAARYRGS